MKISGRALLRACLVASLPMTALAQAPVIVEAESGTLGANLTTATLDGNTYITTTLNATGTPTPDRTATYQVTFPAAGNYALYARIRVGTNGADDDSFYVGNGFGSPNWAGPYNSPTGGFTAANAVVIPGGSTGTLTFKWVRLTVLPGFTDNTLGPANWVVPAGNLTQTFTWGSREDGLFFDKFAFAIANVCFTVAELNTGVAGTATCPAPPADPPEPPPFTRTGPPIAAGKEKYLGSAWSPGTASLTFANYWNQVTPENGGKWGTVEFTQDTMNWTQADESYALAQQHGYKFKWHTLVWGNQQPPWIAALTPAQQLEEIHEWYAAIAERYPNIDQIDVVNEPLHSTPSYIAALGGANGLYGTGWDWVIKSFELARQYFPHSQLVLNDFSITNDGNATTNYLRIIQLLQDRGLIDAIGDQGHAFSTTEPAPMNNHRNNLNRLAATGLPIYISELDLDGVAQGAINHEVQLANYQRVFPVFWEHPAVQGITIWGYVRGFHWRNAQGDWLIYANGGERPAMQWLASYVANNEPEVVRDQSFIVSESLAAGSAVGAIQARDPDSGATFSQWQLTDPTGTFEIDANTGVLRLRAAATLDFEFRTRFALTVSVWDGFRRSKPEDVGVFLTNVNDNAPVVKADFFEIEAGKSKVADIEVSDADSDIDPTFTKFQDFKIVGGDAGDIFALDPVTGTLTIANAGAIDWTLRGYTIVVTVSDGTHTSAATPIVIYLPRL